jgi:hypothetical protein
MKYTTTTTEITVHPEEYNPIFGEHVTKIKLDDEAGGAFVLLIQDDQQIRLDFEEFDFVSDAVRILRLESKKKGFE